MNSYVYYLVGGITGIFLLLAMAGIVCVIIRLLVERCDEVHIEVSWRGIKVTYVKKRIEHHFVE